MYNTEEGRSPHIPWNVREYIFLFIYTAGFTCFIQEQWIIIQGRSWCNARVEWDGWTSIIEIIETRNKTVRNKTVRSWMTQVRSL